ncbi:MAG: leucine-rich repeat domain-containing protein, partial [Paludibacteraceae bacterium]|nr:leucine-rich repeat domain-containing protein [Paludibacteraceae bacterium]
MKKLFLLLALALTVYGTAMADDTPASNEIWYTSMNKTQVTPYVTNAFGATIQSNVYDTEADRGVISFDGTVTNIGDLAFYRCDELVFVKYPTTVTSIGEDAFNGCTKLSSIDLQEGLTSIGVRAFAGCAGMEELTIPSTVTSIGKKAFHGCTTLSTLTVKNGSIGEDAFN